MKKILLILFFYFSLLTLKAQGTWTQEASLPDTGRAFAIGFSVGNYGYIGLGGNGNNLFYHDLWRYNTLNNTWTRMADFPGEARISPEVFVIGNNAYIVMGTDSTYTCTKECWKYNATNNTWTKKNNFPAATRAYGVGFSIGNKGFIGTGCYEYMGNPYDYYKDFWEYDTISDSWTRRADLGGIARIGANGFARGSNGYICFGGDSAYTMQGDMWKYDTNTNIWAQENTCPGASVDGASGFLIGNRIYAGTGQGSFAYYYRAFWEYNCVTGLWSSITSFPGIAISGSSSFEVNGRGYIGIGLDSLDYCLHYFYEFTPDTLTTSTDNFLTINNNSIVFPNPNNGQFNIELTHHKLVTGNQIVLEIYNVLGVKIYDTVLNQPQIEIQINLSTQPSGIYLHKMANEDGLLIANGTILIE